VVTSTKKSPVCGRFFVLGLIVCYILNKEEHMQEEKFGFGDICEIVELGPGGFHFEARENFVGKKVVFVSHDKDSLDGKGFIACTLRLSENICTNNEAQEYMLSEHEFYFPCVKLKKAT
jgi:hypothetical protein